jgi:putative transposase
LHPTPLDEQYLLAASRYVELNPVKAGLTDDPATYGWSSARGHIEDKDDELAKVRPLLEIVNDWGRFLAAGIQENEQRIFQKHERTGRPLGTEEFIKNIESMVNRLLRKQKPGPKQSLQKNN